MEDVHILYEDRHLVLCVKPVGVLSEDSETGACMPALLRQHYQALGQPDYIATVHRLDKVVGGVMLFSRRREVTGKLTAAVAERRITKEYLAVLRGHPQESAATLTDLLFRDASRNKSYVVKRMRKGVREASLEYVTLGRTEELTLVQVRLHTGRTTRSACSSPPAVCRCWATSATAARPSVPRPCGPTAWRSPIPSPASRWMSAVHRPGAGRGRCFLKPNKIPQRRIKKMTAGAVIFFIRLYAPC